MSFSRDPRRPSAPGSSPPCPASMTMVAMRATPGFAAGLDCLLSCSSWASGSSCHQGMDVEHQAVAVIGDRRQGEDLRLHFGLEVEHQANDAGPVARHAQALDVRVVRRDLGMKLSERRRQVVGLQVEHQPLGILDAEDGVLDRLARFEREAGVIARRPDARRQDLRFARYCVEDKEESQARPASEQASKDARRASPSNCRVMRTSGGESRSPAFSGHSTMQTEPGLKCSRKPEFSHSERSLNR